MRSQKITFVSHFILFWSLYWSDHLLSGLVHSSDLHCILNLVVVCQAFSTFYILKLSADQIKTHLFQILHASSVHKMSPKLVLDQFSYNKSPKVCCKCNLAFESPLALALHLDRHDRSIRCDSCQMSFISAAHYYRKDSCKDKKSILGMSRGKSYKANFGINYIKNGLDKLNVTLNYINFDVNYS